MSLAYITAHLAFVNANEAVAVAKADYDQALDLMYAAGEACQAGISVHSFYFDVLASDRRIALEQACRFRDHCSLKLDDVAHLATSSEVAG